MSDREQARRERAHRLAVEWVERRELLDYFGGEIDKHLSDALIGAFKDGHRSRDAEVDAREAEVMDLNQRLLSIIAPAEVGGGIVADLRGQIAERDATIERLRSENAMLLASADADALLLTQAGRDQEKLRTDLAAANEAIRWYHGYEVPGWPEFPPSEQGKRYGFRSVARTMPAVMAALPMEPAVRAAMEAKNG